MTGDEPETPGLWTPRTFYVVMLLMAIHAFSYMDRMTLAILIEPIKHDLRLSDTQIGSLTGFAFVAIYGLAAPLLGRLADRSGANRVLALSVAIWSIMTAGCGVTRNFMSLAFMRAGVGIGEAGCLPASHAMISSIFPRGRRAVPLALHAAGSALGITLGLAIAGVAAAHFGWRAAFWIVAAPGLLLAPLALLTFPRGGGSSRDRQHLPWRTELATILRLRTYRRLVVAQACYALITGGLVTWLPAFYIRVHSMSTAAVGVFFGLAYGVGLAIGLIVGALVLERLARDDPSRAPRIAGWLLLVSTPFYLTALLIQGVTPSLAAMMLFGLIVGAAGSPIVAAQQDVVAPGQRAFASSLAMIVSSYFGAGLGPFLVGLTSQSLTASLGIGAIRAALIIASAAILMAGIWLLAAARSYVSEIR